MARAAGCSRTRTDGSGTEKGSWTLRGFGAWLDTKELRFESGPSIDPFPFLPTVEFSFTLGDGSGAGLALEYRATHRLGMEALAIRADLDGELRLSISNPQFQEQVVPTDVEGDLYGLGLNVHLTPSRRFDVYVGPLVAYVDYGNFKGSFDIAVGPGDLMGSAEVRFDDDKAYGATLGADVPLGRSGAWAVSAAVRKLWYDSKGGGDRMSDRVAREHAGSHLDRPRPVEGPDRRYREEKTAGGAEEDAVPGLPAQVRVAEDEVGSNHTRRSFLYG